MKNTGDGDFLLPLTFSVKDAIFMRNLGTVPR